MTLNNPYQTYQRQAVTTSKPEDLTLMLYQGLVKFIRLSKLAVQNNNFEESHKNNVRAQDILTELMVTLKTGYAISDQLQTMYDYMKTRLVEANISKNIEVLEEVEGFALELTDTWSNAIKQMKVKN
jgi:flagellar secretion chaperone FliS